MYVSPAAAATVARNQFVNLRGLGTVVHLSARLRGSQFAQGLRYGAACCAHCWGDAADQAHCQGERYADG
jgi:hypothetical protein